MINFMTTKNWNPHGVIPKYLIFCCHFSTSKKRFFIATDNNQELNNDDPDDQRGKNISLKIKSLFHSMHYNVHNDRDKTPLQVINILSLYKWCKSRELICKRMKQNRLDLAKFIVKKWISHAKIPVPSFSFCFILLKSSSW